jgi:hypothetical protein
LLAVGRRQLGLQSGVLVAESLCRHRCQPLAQRRLAGPAGTSTPSVSRFAEKVDEIARRIEAAIEPSRARAMAGGATGLG